MLRRSLGLFSLLVLSGCSSSIQNASLPATSLALKGNVFGGQQPVTGSSVQIYATGLSSSASAATPLLAAAAVSDSSGNFSLTGSYSCPTAASQVYIVARGGNPGLAAGTNNSAIVLVAALGPCGTLSASSFININEVTTVALASVVGPFASSVTSMGSLPTDAGLLASAFTTAAEFASTATGSSPGANLPAGLSVPVAKINTLADILAACVNTTGGVANDGSACGTLFSLTTPSGLSAPVDVFTAALRIADNPSLNVSGLFGLVPASGTFQPTVNSVPQDWSVQASLPAGLTSSTAILSFGSVNTGVAATPQTVVLSNSGSSSVAISSIALTGISAVEYSQTNNCPLSLAPSASCTVQVSFTASAGGRRVAALVVMSGSPTGPILVNLSGVGIAATVTAPTLTAYSPSNLAVGYAGVITLTGTNFTPTTFALFSNQTLTTTYISPTAVSFVLPIYATGPGSFSVYVRNSAGFSGTLILSINNPAPTLTSLLPAAVLASAPNFTMTLTGTNFVSGTTVLINGVSHTPYVNSSTSLTFSVSSSEVAAPGNLPVTIVNPAPGGGSSAALTLQVIGSSNRVRTLAYSTSDILTDPVRTIVYGSIYSSSATSPNSVVAIDPVQGTAVATQNLNTTPGRLAISDDGSLLYVLLPNTNEVARFSLPALTPDIRFAVPAGAFDIKVAPGQPHTFAISTASPVASPVGRTVMVYDDAVARPTSPAVSYAGNSFDTLAWGADASTIYATRSGTSGGPEFVLSVNPSGVTLNNTYVGTFGDFLRRMTFDPTTKRVYDGYGNVVDPTTGTQVGHFNIQNTLSYQQNDVAIDAAGGRAFVLNENYFSTTSGGPTEDLQAFDLNTYSFLNAMQVPSLSGMSRIVRWGASGLMAGGGSQLLLIDGSFVATGGAGGGTGTYAGVSPTLTAITPQSIPVGAPDTDVVVTGRDFTPAAVATWNSNVLPLTWQSSTQVTVTVRAAWLTTAVASSLTVTNGAGTESSNAIPLVVLPNLGVNTQVTTVSVSGQDMAYDSTRGLLYVAVTNPNVPYGNSIAVVDPASGSVRTAINTGFQPSTLGISDDGQFLYAGFKTLAVVRRYKLSDLSLDLTIPLNLATANQNFAGDIKVAPGQNQTIAVSFGSPNLEPRNTGGLAIFDNATARAYNQNTGSYKLTWGADASHLYGNSDPELQGQGFSLLTVNGSSIGVTSSSSTLTNLGLRPHYDGATNLIYSDAGRIIDPASGLAAGAFGPSSLVTVDGTLNRAYVLTQNGVTPYALLIYDLRRQTLLNTINLGGISGYPTQLMRWGAQGLALLTDGPGMMYLLQGTDISGHPASASNAISLSPMNIVLGNAPTVTVTGTNFTASSTVFVNGLARATTFVSPTQVSFVPTSQDVATVRLLTVVVESAATGGTSSTPAVLEIDNPAPVITSVTPSALTTASSPAAMVISGTGFLPGSTVNFNGSSRTSSYVSSTSLTVFPVSNDLAAPGNLAITVSNIAPGGGTSAAATVAVSNGLPVLTGVSPSQVAAGSAGQQIFLIGSKFISSSVVTVNGTSMPVTYYGTTQLGVNLPASMFATPGSLAFVVTNAAPGGGTSALATLAVNSGIPAITSLTPNTVIQGATPPALVTVNGLNFIPTSVVQVGGQSRTTTYVSATQLTVRLIAADQATTTTRSLSVVNPAANGGASGSFPLTVAAATVAPVITSVSPATITAGSGTTFLSIYGNGITSNSTAYWNGTALTGNGGTGYTLAAVPANLVATAGTASLTVSTPTSTPTTSAPVTVTIVNPPAPTLSTVSPLGGAINTDVTLTLTGADFLATSVVSFNGQPVACSLQGSTGLTATIPGAMVVPGNNQVTVTTGAPGGGTSAAVIFTGWIAQANNSMVYNPVNGLMYVSVPGSAGAPYGNSVVSIDPVTGAMGTPILVGSEPNRLALTSDGRFLWVSLEGAQAVRKVDLQTGTAGLQFSVPVPSTTLASTPYITALAAVPGQTDSVVVAYNTGYNGAIAIYDSGVVRGAVAPLAAYSLQIDGTTGEVYAAGGTAYTVFTYSSTGLHQKFQTTASNSLTLYADQRVQVAGGRAYSDLGTVLNAETGALIGVTVASPYAPISSTADVALGRIFALDSTLSYASYPNRIQVFNASDLSLIGTNNIPVNVVPATYVLNAVTTGLTRWGANGLAFRTSANVYAIRSNLVADLSATNADLAVSLSGGAAVSTGATTSYVATIVNNGPTAATETRLTVLLPSTGVLTSITPSAGTCSMTGVPTCNLGTLANGASVSVTLQVTELTSGGGTLTVRADSSENDPNVSNNQASVALTITGNAVNPPPTMASISPATVLAGSSDTVITVNGANFVAGTTVRLDGSALPTTLVSANQLSAIVPAPSIASLGWHAVAVSTPAPGGGSTSVLPLTVYAAIKGNANRIVFDPYSRSLIASLGPTIATGNSLEFIIPDTATVAPPIPVGSGPTRMALTDDGNILYVLLSSGSSLERFNMTTRLPEFSLPLPPTFYFTDATGYYLSVQPGNENTVALSQGTGILEIADFNPANHTANVRPSTTSYGSYGTSAFLDPSNLLVTSYSLADYTVNASGLAPLDASKTTTPNGSFKLSGKQLVTTAGQVVDMSTIPGHLVGTFPLMTTTSEADIEPDASIGLAYVLVNSTSTGVSNYHGVNEIAAFSTKTFSLAATIPLDITTVDGATNASNATPVDVVRWGQDGIAALTTSGTIYLARGPAVLPQLLQTNAVPTVAAVQALTHGAGNTKLNLTGSGFVPGVVAYWNGNPRTTIYVDATDIAVAIPAADLAVSGSATIVVSNPGSATSPAVVAAIQ